MYYLERIFMFTTTRNDIAAMLREYNITGKIKDIIEWYHYATAISIKQKIY